MTDLTGNTLGAGLLRQAVLTRARVDSLKSGTARRYLQYQALRASLELFKPGAFVTWVSYLFPPELLASYDLAPMIPEVAAATLTGSDFRPAVEAACDRLPLSRDVCSYHRSAFASLQDQLLPPPNLCLGTTPLCLGKELLLSNLSQTYGVPFQEIRVPLPPDEGPAPDEDIADVAEQLRELHEEIGRVTRRRPHLERTINLSNRASAAWRSISEGRLNGDLVLDGRRTFALGFLGQILWGSEAGAKGFERMLSERGRRDLQPPAGSNPRLRLLWLHTLPHHDPSLFDLIAERGGAVVFEEMSQLHLDQLDPADPFPGLARGLLENPLWGSSARRARKVTELAQRLQVDGVVHFNHWGCRHGVGSVTVVREAVQKAGFPFLAVDGDALASRGAHQDSSAEQMESFLEML